MSLSSRSLALQGFLLTPICMAVQGLLGIAAPVDPPPVDLQIQRSAIVGRGPGTTLNYSEFLRQKYKPSQQVEKLSHAQTAAKRKTKLRQRMEEEVLSLTHPII